MENVFILIESDLENVETIKAETMNKATYELQAVLNGVAKYSYMRLSLPPCAGNSKQICFYDALFVKIKPNQVIEKTATTTFLLDTYKPQYLLRYGDKYLSTSIFKLEYGND